MKFSAPIVAALAAMSYPVVSEGYSLWGPTLFEPALTFSPMMRRQRALTNRFDEAFKHLSPRYEITNNPDQFQIAMDVPGVKMEDVNVCVEDGGKVLTIRGSRRARNDDSSFESKFSQSFSLDPVIDVDNIQANMMDGVLTITAPKDMKRLEENIRSIPIAASAPPVLESPKLEAASDVENEKADEDEEVQDLDAQTHEVPVAEKKAEHEEKK